MSFSAARVNAVVRRLLQGGRKKTLNAWLQAVCALTYERRPDLAAHIHDHWLGVEPDFDGVLSGLSIGEIGACYEALLALTNRESRKRSGQFFTPDDAAQFMARHSLSFPSGMWLDPCCGVGNLSWHLASVQDDPADFVAERLTVMDIDPVALKTAVALIGAQFLAADNVAGFEAFSARALRQNFLTRRTTCRVDYVIVNPPYARAPHQRGYDTGATQELFAFFLERIAKIARGFISVTPASYVCAPKYQVLRDVLGEQYRGGSVYVFDNVPDTFFRGFKYGSTNSSSTNFVRAAVTVCQPQAQGWQITPIMRWHAADRPRLWESTEMLLSPRALGPHGEWAKLLPGMETLWAKLIGSPRTLGSLLAEEETPHRLDVAVTPRYFISAAFRCLDRGAKVTLFFPNEATRDLAALIVNSSLSYLWWRALDGGVTLTKKVLLSVPIPDSLESADPQTLADMVRRLRESEQSAVVTKQNAGRANENIKHDADLIRELDVLVLPELTEKQRKLLYTNAIFK